MISSTPRALLPKNLSAPWALSATLAVWFLFVHSPPLLHERFGSVPAFFVEDPPFAVHLLGAYAVYLACVHNTLLTPSCLDGRAGPYHVYVGRIGMVAGLVGFALGAYCAWSPHRGTDRGFAIGITIGGAMQVLAQVGGYASIRRYQILKREAGELTASIPDKVGEETYYGSMNEKQARPSFTRLDQLTSEMNRALRMHVKCMVGLFAVACGVPALLRIVGDIAFLDALGSGAIWISAGVLNCLAIPFERVYTKRIG